MIKTVFIVFKFKYFIMNSISQSTQTKKSKKLAKSYKDETEAPQKDKTGILSCPLLSESHFSGGIHSPS